MEPQLITSMNLDNGLALEIWDASRKVAADRWLVKLIARMDIEVSEGWFGNKLEPPAAIDQMRSKLGEAKRFEYQTERHFVDQKEKQLIFDNMQKSLEAKIAYYSHPDFAARYLIKAYATHQRYPNPA